MWILWTILKHVLIIMCVHMCVSAPVGCGGVWLETRPDVSVLPGSQPRGYQGNVNTVCVQTDKGVTLSRAVTHFTYMYSLVSSRLLLILSSSICQVVCYPGSTWIFSASRDKTVLMWDLNQGDEPIQEFCGHELVVNGLAISPGTHTRTNTHAMSKYLNSCLKAFFFFA